MFRKLLKRKNNKAFSLVEILCAICLLALVTTPILQIIIGSMNMNKRSSEMLAASDLASDTIEYITSLSFEDYNDANKGVRTHYYGKDTGNSLLDLDFFTNQGSTSNPQGVIKLYNGGPSGKIKKADYKDVDASTGYTGRSLYITDISYSNYKFDAKLIFQKKSTEAGKYFAYDCIVEIYEPRTTKDDGSYVYGKKLVEVSTCIPNSYK